MQAVKILVDMAAGAAGLVVMSLDFPFVLIPCFLGVIAAGILLATVPRKNRPLVIGCAIQIGYGLWVLGALGLLGHRSGWQLEPEVFFRLIDPLILIVLPVWLAYSRSFLLVFILCLYQIFEIFALNNLSDSPGIVHTRRLDVLAISIFFRASGLVALAIGLMKMGAKPFFDRGDEEVGENEEEQGRSEQELSKEEKENPYRSRG